MKYHLLQLFTNSYIIDVAHYNFIPQSSLLDSGLFLKLELINICIHMCMFVCLFISLNIGMYVHSFIIICFYLLRSKHTVIIIRLHCSESISIHFSFLIAFTHSLLSFFFSHHSSKSRYLTVNRFTYRLYEFYTAPSLVKHYGRHGFMRVTLAVCSQ